MAYAKASRKQDSPFLWNFPCFLLFFYTFANLQLTPVSFAILFLYFLFFFKLMIIPECFEPPNRILRTTIPENESQS